MNKYIIDLWFSESNTFKLATLRNLISLKRIQRKELPQKTRKKTRKTLNEEGSGGGVVPLRSSINPHICRTTLALFFRVTPTRPAMRNTRVSSISVERFARMREQVIMHLVLRSALTREFSLFQIRRFIYRWIRLFFVLRCGYLTTSDRQFARCVLSFVVDGDVSSCLRRRERNIYIYFL